MAIIAKQVTRKNAKQVLQIYEDAFPAWERIHFFMLRIMSFKWNNEFLAMYDDNKLCGLVYLVHKKGMTLLYYLAVAKNMRQQGYGSKILQWVIKTYAPSMIILGAETLHEPCNNLEERKKRNKFYLKNGMYDTNYYMIDFSGKFDMLCTQPTFDPIEYRNLVQEFTWWMKPITVAKHILEN